MATPPIFLPGEPHGQRSLTGYSPWGCKESDTTEQLTRCVHFGTRTVTDEQFGWRPHGLSNHGKAKQKFMAS